MTEQQPDPKTDEQADSVSEQPALELPGTVLEFPSNLDRVGALQAGLAAAFSADQSVVIGSAGQSVLKTLGQTFGSVPRVALRDAVEEGEEPIVRPKSAEMPQRDSDSRYQLQGEIARGGMGAILKGRDTDLGRDLAIKVLLDQHKNKPEVIQRFVEEAQIGGQLQHPGIAPIYELGTFADNRPFFAMKLVKGETLSKLLADRDELTTERGKFIGIFEQICQTVAYAHSRGVIHRDLKPANIMVGAFGEVQVMDWGLAKVLPAGGIADEKKSLDKSQGQSVIQTLRSQVGSDLPGTFGTVGSHTQMGSVMGTPAYMPPEQALGEIDNLDERADVFGLGAILSEILTGKPPYVGDDGTQVYRMASRGKLADCFQRLDDCGADGDLIALAKHCLELEPKDRPRDAGVLADRVTAHLASVESRLRAVEVQRAAEAARAEEALHTAREHEAAASAERRARKMQLGLAVVVLGVLAVGGIASTWTAAVQTRLKNNALLAEQAANKAREKEAEQRQRAEEQQALAEQQKSRAEVAQQQSEAEKIRSVNMLADMQTERGLLAGREGQTATAALWFANAAALTPHDHDRQVANQRRAQTWSDQGMQPVALLKLGHDARRMEFQPSGRLMMTLQANGLRVWDWRHEELLPWCEQLPLAIDAVMSPDGTSIAALLGTGEVLLLDPDSGQILRRIHSLSDMYLIERSPDGSRLALAGTRLQIWNIEGEAVLESDWAHPAKISGLRFSRSGRRIVCCSEDNLAHVFAVNDASLPAPLFPPINHWRGINQRETAPVFCDDDRRLVTISSTTYHPELREATTGAILPVDWKLTHYFDRSLQASPDDRWVAVGGEYDGALLKVDGTTSIVLPHANHLHLALFAPDGQSLATLGYEGIVRLFPLRDLNNAIVGMPSIIPQQSTFGNGAFSPDSHALAVSSNQQVVIWERKPSSSILGQIAWVNSSWRPRPSFDGRFVTPSVYHEYYAGFTPGSAELNVVRMVDGTAAGPTIPLIGRLYDSCVCSDNASVAAVTVDHENGWLSLFDIVTGAPKWRPLELPAPPLGVDARPGRPQMAVLCQNGQLLVIDTASGEFEQSHAHIGVSGNASHARVAYSPDGATIVTVLQSNQVILRDAETGELRCPPFNPVLEGGLCRSIAFSPDSRLFATAVTGKNMAQVWSLATGEKVGVGMPHPGDVFGLWSIEFSPDGKRLLTGHKDGRIRTFDWLTGEIVGTPLQHLDEVNDIQFTPDGRHLMACVRNGTVHVWDVATGKLAVPLLPDIKPAGASTQSLGVAGDRAVVSANPRYSLLDLSLMLPEIAGDVPSQLRRAELATNQKLQVGELVPLESREWSARWEQLVSNRQTPEAAAEALAKAFDACKTDSGRQAIVARAFHLKVVDILQRIRPNDAGLARALVAEYTRAGNRVEAKRLLPTVIAATRAALETSPDNESIARELVQLLVDDLPEPVWDRLEPVTMNADSNCALTRQSNGTILSGPASTPQGDTYTLTSRSPLRQIAALRLETFPHESLPNEGQGWGLGNFCLTEVRAELQRADGTKRPLKFRSAASDYVRDYDSNTNPLDGPWSMIDGDHSYCWDVSPQLKTPHWLMLEFVEPFMMDEDDELTVHLDCRHALRSQFRLGCFRLSVSNEAAAVETRTLLDAIRALDLTSNEALACVMLIRGDAVTALQRLQSADGNVATVASPTRMLLLAKAYQYLGETAAAREVMNQLLDNMTVSPPPRAVFGLFLELAIDVSGRTQQELLNTVRSYDAALSQLTRAILDDPASPAKYSARAIYQGRLGEWALSAADFAAALKFAPQDRVHWQNVASSLLLAGDEAKYRAHCLAMVQQFRDSADFKAVGTLCKVCLLAPGAIDLSEVPLAKLRDIATSAESANYQVFSIPNCALAAYREGNYEEAIKWSEQAPNLKGFIGAQVFATRAMAEEKLERHDEAVQSLALAEALIPEELDLLGTSAFAGALPVAESIVYRDWLVDEVLRREAALLIHKEKRRRSSPETLQAECTRLARLGRWPEAAKVAMKEVKLQPTYRILWSKAAALLALAEDEEAYRELCVAMTDQFRDKITAEQADSVCKSCLLLPGCVDFSKLPVQQLENSLSLEETPDAHRVWFLASLALVAYRGGDAESAIRYVTRSEELPTGSLVHALNLPILALSRQQLNQTDEARRVIEEARKHISHLQVNVKEPAHHDLFCAQVLLREAEAKINGRSDPK